MRALIATTIATLFFLFQISQAHAECSAEIIRSDRSKFMDLYKEKKYLRAANVLGETIQRCQRELREGGESTSLYKEFYWAFSDYVLSLYKAGELKICISKGRSVLDGYHKYYQDRNAPEIVALDKNIKMCEAAWEDRNKIYKKERCDIYSYSATGIDSSVFISPNGNQKSCVALHSGWPNDRNLDLHEGGAFSSMDRPYLIEVIESDRSNTEKYYALNGGSLGRSENFAPNDISIALVNGNKIIRIKGFSSYLWSGNASFYIDAFYELMNDGRANLVDELVVGYR